MCLAAQVLVALAIHHQACLIYGEHIKDFSPENSYISQGAEPMGIEEFKRLKMYL